MGKGSKAKMPDFVPVDATREQKDAISGNLLNFDKAQNLAERTNAANTDDLLNTLRRVVPGYDNIVNQSSKVIQSGLKGELPQDVVDQIKRTTAERSLSGGFSGSGASRNLTARDLGRTSLDLTYKALDQGSNFTRTQRAIATPQLMGVQDMFVTPQQRIEQANRNSMGMYQAQAAKAQADAAPNPTLASLSGFASDVGGTLFGYGMQDWSSQRQFDRNSSLISKYASKSRPINKYSIF